MPDSELAVVAAKTFPAPILIERAGPSTRKKFFEFFYGPDPQRAHTSRLITARFLESTSLGWRHLLRSLKAPVSTRSQL